MVMRRIVLINQSTTRLPFADLLLVTQALQTQIDRDFAPLWGIRAQITALRRHDPLPAGAWVLRLVDEAPEDAGIQLMLNINPSHACKPAPIGRCRPATLYWRCWRLRWDTFLCVPPTLPRPRMGIWCGIWWKSVIRARCFRTPLGTSR